MTFKVTKDPSEVLDYSIDYSQVLQAVSPVDAISVSTWVADTGITINSESDNGLIATVWLSGGTQVGRSYKVTNHITTTGGRQYERTISVKITQK